MHPCWAAGVLKQGRARQSCVVHRCLLAHACRLGPHNRVPYRRRCVLTKMSGRPVHGCLRLHHQCTVMSYCGRVHAHLQALCPKGPALLLVVIMLASMVQSGLVAALVMGVVGCCLFAVSPPPASFDGFRYTGLSCGGLHVQARSEDYALWCVGSGGG